MSSEKISPTSARRRYERRKVIIRSKAQVADDEEAAAKGVSPEEAGSVAGSQAGATEKRRAASSTSLPKEAAAAALPSGKERLRSKSEGHEKEEQQRQSRTSYVETFDETTQEAAINMVLNQAQDLLLKNFQSDPAPSLQTARKTGPPAAEASSPSSAVATNKRKKSHGNSHPLSKLTAQSRKHPFYSTM